MKRTHYSAAEIAEMAGLSESTVLRWAASGKLPSVRLPGTHRRLFPAEQTLRVLNGDDGSSNKVLALRRRAS